MKRGAIVFARAAFAAAAAAAALTCFTACSKVYFGYGQVRLKFIRDGFTAVRSSETEVPDSNSFILEIRDADGKEVYKGLYGDCPEEITAPSGSCLITVRSGEFSTPKFSAPLYGDDQCIVVPSGGVVDVALDCRLLNCGMALSVSPDFLTAYPSGVLYISSSEGKLMYAYTERRVAYFMPGNISVLLNDISTGEETVLMTRTLAAREILTMAIGVAAASTSSAGGISMQIDTTKTWLDDSYVIGGDNNRGTEMSTAMSVAEAKANVGLSGVWVYGYIVGGDLTSSASGISFSAPFSSTSNLAVAAKSSVSDKSACMSVQLPSGDIRNTLNLVENPQLLGRQVYLKGDITASYFSIVGIKNISAYELK